MFSLYLFTLDSSCHRKEPVVFLPETQFDSSTAYNTHLPSNRTSAVRIQKTYQQRSTNILTLHNDCHLRCL